jgi:hypothetical protein
MSIHFTIERTDRRFRAKADGGAAFFVGNQTRFHDKPSGEDFEGLFNVPSKELPKLVYKADNVRATYGFWADFIEPTSRCEGGNFLTLNTYDRAKFTWGFAQFGAHVPDGDFVLFFRDMLRLPGAVDYFPELALKNDRINRVVGDRFIPLEDAASTRGLMDFLNPTTSAVEDAEVIAAAKLIHWTTNAVEAQSLQVKHMIAVFKRLVSEADRRLGLDGKTADLCLVICDIRHQGRAKFSAMQNALNAAKPLAELLALGSLTYPDRIKTLTQEVKARQVLLGGKTWNRAAGDFV